MNTKRRFSWLVAGLVILLLMGLSTSASAMGNQFKDISTSDPNYPLVKYLSNRNIITGYADGTFRPIAPITRAEMAVLMLRAKGLSVQTTITKSTFKDVSPKYWAYNAIETAAKEHLLSGYTDGTFQPDRPITRSEASVLILRLTDTAQPQIEIPAVVKDVDTKYWAGKQIAIALDSGIMSLKSPGSFAPEQFASRAEIAKGLAIMLNLAPETSMVPMAVTVIPVKGEVTIGEGEKEQINKAATLKIGVPLQTGQNSEAEIKFPDGSSIMVESNTKLIIKTALAQTTVIRDGSVGYIIDNLKVTLIQGKIFGVLATSYSRNTPSSTVSVNILAKLASLTIPDVLCSLADKSQTAWYKNPYEKKVRVTVDMPWGVAAIRGTIWGNAVTSTGQTTSVADGSAEMTAGGTTVSVPAGKESSINSASAPPTAPIAMPLSEQQAWKQQMTWIQQVITEIIQNAPAISPPTPVEQQGQTISEPQQQTKGIDVSGIVQSVIQSVQKTVNGETASPTIENNSGSGSHNNNTVAAATITPQTGEIVVARRFALQLDNVISNNALAQGTFTVIVNDQSYNNDTVFNAQVAIVNGQTTICIPRLKQPGNHILNVSAANTNLNGAATVYVKKRVLVFVPSVYGNQVGALLLSDDGVLADKSVTFYAIPNSNPGTAKVLLGTSSTGSNGIAVLDVSTPPTGLNASDSWVIQAVFNGDNSCGRASLTGARDPISLSPTGSPTFVRVLAFDGLEAGTTTVAVFSFDKTGSPVGDQSFGLFMDKNQDGKVMENEGILLSTNEKGIFLATQPNTSLNNGEYYLAAITQDSAAGNAVVIDNSNQPSQYRIYGGGVLDISGTSLSLRADLYDMDYNPTSGDTINFYVDWNQDGDFNDSGELEGSGLTNDFGQVRIEKSYSTAKTVDYYQAKIVYTATDGTETKLIMPIWKPGFVPYMAPNRSRLIAPLINRVYQSQYQVLLKAYAVNNLGVAIPNRKIEFSLALENSEDFKRISSFGVTDSSGLATLMINQSIIDSVFPGHSFSEVYEFKAQEVGGILAGYGRYVGYGYTNTYQPISLELAQLAVSDTTVKLRVYAFDQSGSLTTTSDSIQFYIDKDENGIFTTSDTLGTAVPVNVSGYADSETIDLTTITIGHSYAVMVTLGSPGPYQAQRFSTLTRYGEVNGLPALRLEVIAYQSNNTEDELDYIITTDDYRNGSPVNGKSVTLKMDYDGNGTFESTPITATTGSGLQKMTLPSTLDGRIGIKVQWGGDTAYAAAVSTLSIYSVTTAPNFERAILTTGDTVVLDFNRPMTTDCTSMDTLRANILLSTDDGANYHALNVSDQVYFNCDGYPVISLSTPLSGTNKNKIKVTGGTFKDTTCNILTTLIDAYIIIPD